jgi:hypothetical protein
MHKNAFVGLGKGKKLKKLNGRKVCHLADLDLDLPSGI